MRLSAAGPLGPPSDFYKIWPTVEEVSTCDEGLRAGGSCLSGVSNASRHRGCCFTWTGASCTKLVKLQSYAFQSRLCLSDQVMMGENDVPCWSLTASMMAARQAGAKICRT